MMSTAPSSGELFVVVVEVMSFEVFIKSRTSAWEARAKPSPCKSSSFTQED